MFSKSLCIAAMLTGLVLTLQAGNEIADAIAAARKNGESHVRIAPGTYRQDRPLMLEKLERMTIDATGATLLITQPINAIRISHCRDLTIRGLTVDYDPLPFTQGTITTVAPDRRSFEFKLHDGYPRMSKTFVINRAHLFDGKTRLWKDGASDLYGKSEYTVPDRGRFVLNQPEPTLQTGDMIVLNRRQTTGIHIMGMNRNIRLEDVTIFTAPGLGICGRFNYGGDFFRVSIRRGPRPTGATEDRLFSTCADAFNYAYTRQGPTLDGCDFSFMGDDSVNLHSAALPVVRVDDGNTIVTIRPQGRESFPEIVRPGDEIRILAPPTFKIVGTARITAAKSIKMEIDREQLKSFYPVAANRNTSRFTVYTFTFAGLKGEIPPGSFFDIPAIAASGYRIVNSSFHDHRARGLRLMSSNGLVENNTFARIKHAAIAAGGEYAYWREAGWVDNIVIHNNRLTQIGTGRDIAAPDSYAPGAISVFAQLRSYRDVTPLNRNLTISDNTIDGSTVPGIFVFATDGIVIRNNRISNTCSDAAAQPGSEFGFKAAAPISINHSVRVDQSGNQIK